MDRFAITWGDPSWKESQQLREQRQETERERLLMVSLGLLDPARPKVIAPSEPVKTVSYSIAMVCANLS